MRAGAVLGVRGAFVLAFGAACQTGKPAEYGLEQAGGLVSETGADQGDTETIEQPWEDTDRSETPLIIIGGGVSGMNVALAAGRGLILEADSALGGRARYNTAVMTCVGCPELVSTDTDDSVDTAVAQWLALTGDVATDTTRDVLEGSAGMQALYAGLGLSFDVFPRATTRGTPRLISVVGGDGTLADALAGALPATVEVRLNTKVEDVVIEDGRATGVRVDGAFLPASAVVIASGGFAGNATALAGVAGDKDGSWDSSPIAGAQGDALGWADAQGWAVGRRDAVGWYYGTIASGDPAHQPLHLSYFADSVHPWIWVDEEGLRFFDETAIWSLVMSTAMSEHDAVWGITPEETLLGALNVDEVDLWTALVATGTQAFCADNSVTLALAIGVDPLALDTTIGAIGAVIDGSATDEFSRLGATFPDYRSGPLCAWKPGRVALKTFGGLDVDSQGHVLDSSGVAIEDLYAVGEAAGMADPGTGGAHGFDGSLMAVSWSGRRVGLELAR